MSRVKRSTLLTLIFVIFLVVLVAVATITYFYSKKNDVGRVNITLVYGTYSDLDGFEKEDASQNTIHTTVKSVRIGTIANLNYHDFNRVGHSIEGWYLDSEFENKFESGTTIKEDFTLYAKWQLQSYTIRFYSSADRSVNNTNYLESSQTYVYNTEVQVKDENGNYVGGFVNPFNGVNGKYDYVRNPYHQFTGWQAKFINTEYTENGEEFIYDETFYESDSFKMPAQDLNFVVNWEKFKAKVKLVDGELESINNEVKPVTDGYYVKNGTSSLLFNEEDIINYTVLESGFKTGDIKTRLDYNDQEQDMTFERIGWKINSEDSEVYGYNEVNYQVKLSDGKLIEEKDEHGNIIDRYYEITLNANWQKEQVTINFYTGENNKVVTRSVDSFGVVDITDAYNSTRRSGSIIIGWAIPRTFKGDATNLKYDNYAGYKKDDVNYFISSEDYKIINDLGEIEISETNANDGRTLKTLGRKWSEDRLSSDDSALTINLFAIWGYRVVYRDSSTNRVLTTYIPTQISDGQFTATAQLASNNVFTKENSTLLGWSENENGSTVLDEGTIIYSGKISQKEKILYSIWLNGNGSEEVPFQIETMYDWNRVFKYLSVADRYYTDEYGNKIYITESITLDERYSEVFGEETKDYILINENCYIVQTKTFDVKTDPLDSFAGIFAGTYNGKGNQIRVGVDNTTLFSYLGVSLEQGNEERIANILDLNITMLTDIKNNNAILAYYSNNSEVTNCSFDVNISKQSTTDSSISGIGGVFQSAYSKTTLTNCTVSGNINVTLAVKDLHKQIGGFVGYGQANFVNCKSQANIIVKENTDVYGGDVAVGGFIGKSYHESLETLASTIENCETLVSTIEIKLSNANYTAGGFIGYGNVIFKGENTNNIVINSNYSISNQWKQDNNGKYPATSTPTNTIRLGGFIGHATSLDFENTIIKIDENTENLVSPKLINNGQITSNSKPLDNNGESRQINRSKTYIGGIVGQINLVKDLTLKNLINNATLNSIATSTHNEDNSISYIGGLFGYILGDSYDYKVDVDGDNENEEFTIYYKLSLGNVENTGAINSTDVQIYQGGIIGYIDLGENYSNLTLNNVKNNGVQNINSIGGHNSTIKVGGLVGSLYTSAYVGYDNGKANNDYSSVNNGNINLKSANNRTTGSVQVGGAIGCMTIYSYSASTITSDLYINNFTNNGNITEELNHNSYNIIIGGIIGASGTTQLTKVVNNGQIKLKHATNIDNRNLCVYVGGIVGIVSDEVIEENSLRIKSNNILDIMKIAMANQSTINAETLDLIAQDELILTFRDSTDYIYPKSFIELIKEIDCKIQYEQDIVSTIDDVKNTGSININTNTYYWGSNGIAGIVGYHKTGMLNITNTINDKVGLVNSSENISIVSNSIYTNTVYNDLNVGGIVGLAEAGEIINKDNVTETALQIKSNNKESGNIINYQEILINLNSDEVNLAIGGIVGQSKTTLSIDYAKNLGKIKLDVLNARGSTSLTSGAIGGIIGKVSSGRYKNVVNITNCVNGNSEEELTIIEINKLKTTSQSVLLCVGGILGYSSNTCTMNIFDCVNYNTIETKNEIRSALRIGGIAGHMPHGQISASSTNRITTNGGKIILSTTNTTNNNASIYIGGIVGYTNHIILNNVSSEEVIVGSPSFYNTSENYIGGLIGYLYTEKFVSDDEKEDHEIIKKLATGNFIENCITAPVQFTGEANCYIGGAIGYAYGVVSLANELLNLKITNTTSPTDKSIVVNINNTTNTDIENNIVSVGGMIGRLDKMIQTMIGDETKLNELVQNNMSIYVNTIYENKNTTHVGGMIGYAYNTRYSYLNNGLYLNNCVNKGDISVAADNSNIGGLIGYTTDANIVNCKNTSNVKDYTNEKISGDSKMGGLIGYAAGKIEMYLSRFDGGSISINSISTLAGNAMVGGLIGRVEENAIIEDCFVRIGKFDIPKNIKLDEIVSVTRTSLSLGGFVGFFNNKTFNNLGIYHSYVKTNLNQASTINIVIGGVVGKIKNIENLNVSANSSYNFNDLQFSSNLSNINIGNITSEFSDFDKSSITINPSNIWSNSGDIVINDEGSLKLTYVKPNNNTLEIAVDPRTSVVIDQYCTSYVYDSRNGIIREFLGWSEVENVNIENIKYHFGDMIYVTKSMTLYPVFEEITNNSEKSVPGTSMNPYIINTQDDWNTILVSNAYTNTTQSSLVKHFKLGQDIELTNTMLPINKFNGVLDGSNYTLTLNNSKIPFVEMAGTIRNLKVVSNSVQTYTYNDTTFDSCLAVYLNGGIIENSSISGTMQTSAQVIGSFVAHAYSGYINNCTSSVQFDIINVEKNKDVNNKVITTTFGGLVGTSGYIRNNVGENKGELINNVEYSPIQPVNATFNSDANTVQTAKFALVIENSYFIDNRNLQETDPLRGITVRYLNVTDSGVSEGGNVPSIQGGLLGSSTQNVLIYNVKTSDNFVKFNRNKGATGGLLGSNNQGLTRFENCEYNNTDINISGGSYYGNYMGRGLQSQNFTQFINCTNSTNIRSSVTGFGGFVGCGSGLYFSNVKNYGTLSTDSTSSYVGGIIGYIIDGGFYIENSLWDTSSNPTKNEINANNFGGLIGYYNGASYNKSFGGIVTYWQRSEILKSNVVATVSGNVTNFGGLIGYVQSSNGVSMKNVNETKVTFIGETNSLGGLIGRTTSATLTNCSTQFTYNNVNLIGSEPAFGGLIGKANHTIKISSCNILEDNNVVSLTSSNTSYIGGFVGYTQSYSVEISGCKFNTPLTLSIPTSSYIGGAIGASNRSDITVNSNTYINLQTSVVTEFYGGIAGYFNNKNDGNSYYNDNLNIYNSYIGIKNAINSSGQHGLLVGYMSEPTYITTHIDSATGLSYTRINYCYTITGNKIYCNSNARVIGNVVLSEESHYTNNTQLNYEQLPSEI